MTNTSKLPFDDEFTKVPNIIFDLMQHISAAQFAVLMVIVRKTYGWQKVEDIISLSQIAEATGLSQRNVHDALKSLVEQNFVTRRTASPEDMAAKRIKRKPSQQFWYAVNLVAIQIHLHKGAGTPMQDLHMNAENPMQNLHMNSGNPMQNLHMNEAVPMQNLHTQKKESKEKIKETGFSSLSFSSLGESESPVNNTLQADSDPLKAPTPKDDNRSPDAAIAHTLQAWQAIRGGAEKRGEKKTLRDLCAKHGAQTVYRAIIAAKDAGKTDGVGWVKWWVENKATETPVVDWTKYGGGTPDYMRDEPAQPSQAPGLGAVLDSVGKLAPSGGLRRALAASIANNGPVGTYTGSPQNLP